MMVEAIPIRFYERPPSRSELTDRFGRRLTYLRISITDRCNMRCDYCRPAANAYRAEPYSQILTFEEIERIVRVAAGLGVNKVRITGGEPLVRRCLPSLIEKIKQIPGISDLSMTTNATLLAKHADEIWNAGITRINISLDSLNPLRFRKLPGIDLAPVLEGIGAAMAAGFAPIKLNTVLVRGINDEEVPELIDFAAERNLTVRFIELMPMKHGLDWEKHYISIDEVLEQPEVRHRVDVDAKSETGNTAARYLPLKETKGKVGFITPMSERFCDGCNRLRLTADGHLRSCLPDDDELDLRDMIRNGGSDDDIRAVFARAALIKPEIGVYGLNKQAGQRSMIHIGG